MTSETLFEALENCLQALDYGETLETCLLRYPALAEELRPILVAALEARHAAVTEIPAAVAQRGKARVLQAAAELRAASAAAPKPVVLPPARRPGFFGARFFRLAATATLMVAFLLTGGTGLVNASNGALPGDQLYPVKRSWEGLRLVLIFDEEAREELEHKFKQERVEEIEELYTEGRMEQVHFQGLVQSQAADFWVVGGLKIEIEKDTVFQGEMTVDALVEVLGETDDGRIKAEQISLVAVPQATPTGLPTLAPRLTPTLAVPTAETSQKPLEAKPFEAGEAGEKDSSSDSGAASETSESSDGDESNDSSSSESTSTESSSDDD